MTRATGEKASAFANRTLFKILGIWQEETARFTWKNDPEGAHTWHKIGKWDEVDGFLWQVDERGKPVGGFGAHFTAREQAKLGYLYLNEGFWNGTQVISDTYVMDSTSQHNSGGAPEQVPYGYLWWVTQYQNSKAFFAGGYGGKYIYVIPSLDLVVVIASTSEFGPGLHHREIVSRYIIPAITKN